MQLQGERRRSSVLTSGPWRLKGALARLNPGPGHLLGELRRGRVPHTWVAYHTVLRHTVSRDGRRAQGQGGRGADLRAELPRLRQGRASFLGRGVGVPRTGAGAENANQPHSLSRGAPWVWLAAGPSGPKRNQITPNGRPHHRVKWIHSPFGLHGRYYIVVIAWALCVHPLPCRPAPTCACACMAGEGGGHRGKLSL